ncbi:hypothetical protein Pla175_26390 [Pirellulimonas nuda]|uniref:Ice-binding protein C-terminal domain-containing protein n=2 Tax=Pirellulimonas nuda TaxID=2528009 RepID=A0A518DCP5_9BACT|nr:hypothetical protein Pla175_26390 [Pirellulimonas nuda]
MAIAISSAAQAVDWDGGGDGTSYQDPLNWVDDDPTFADLTRNISGAFTVERNVDITVNRTFVNGGAVLNVTGGTQSDGQSGANVFNTVGDSGAGTLNVSGGSYSIGHGLRVGVGAAPDGVVNITGGDLIVFRDANIKAVDWASFGGRGSIEIGDTALTGGGGRLQISGGSLATRAGVYLGETGFFRVVGSAPTSIGIGANGTLDGYWHQVPGSTLEIQIDETSKGVTPISVDITSGTGQGGGNVYFDAGSLLDVSFLGAENQGRFTVMTWDGTVTDNGLAFAPGVDTDLWSFSVNANSLTVQAGDGPFGVPGDFNSDNVVDAADYTVYRDNLGLDSAALNGNGTGESTVVPADYTLWQSQFGASNALSASATPVPEPGSLLLLMVGMAACGARRRA